MKTKAIWYESNLLWPTTEDALCNCCWDCCETCAGCDVACCWLEGAEIEAGAVPSAGWLFGAAAAALCRDVNTFVSFKEPVYSSLSLEKLSNTWIFFSWTLWAFDYNMLTYPIICLREIISPIPCIIKCIFSSRPSWRPFTQRTAAWGCIANTRTTCGCIASTSRCGWVVPGVDTTWEPSWISRLIDLA